MSEMRRGVCLTHSYPVRARPRGRLWVREANLDQLESGVRRENVVLSSVIYHSGANRVADRSSTFYSVVLPLSAHLVADQVNDGLPIVVGRGLVASPTRPMRVHVPIEAMLVILEIERAAVESELSRRLDCALPWPLAFEPTFDVSVGLMSDWCQLARRYLQRSPRHAQELVDETRSLQELLIVGLLRGQPHNYTSLLDRGQRNQQFEAVRAAVDRINRHPESVHTVGDLARASGRSVRSLQEGSRRYVGVTPSEYLRRSRIERQTRHALPALPDQPTRT